MFGISLYELLVILVVALILFKPRDFGTALYNFGKFIKQTKKIIHNFQTEIEKVSEVGDPKDYIIHHKKPDLNSNNNVTPSSTFLNSSKLPQKKHSSEKTDVPTINKNKKIPIDQSSKSII